MIFACMDVGNHQGYTSIVKHLIKCKACKPVSKCKMHFTLPCSAQSLFMLYWFILSWFRDWFQAAVTPPHTGARAFVYKVHGHMVSPRPNSLGSGFQYTNEWKAEGWCLSVYFLHPVINANDLRMGVMYCIFWRLYSIALYFDNYGGISDIVFVIIRPRFTRFNAASHQLTTSPFTMHFTCHRADSHQPQHPLSWVHSSPTQACMACDQVNTILFKGSGADHCGQTGD